VAITTRSQNKEEATAFLDYVKTKEASDMLRKYGFTLPHEY
jgi:ABC-type molybdate transport system substrate-binding protein